MKIITCARCELAKKSSPPRVGVMATMDGAPRTRSGLASEGRRRGELAALSLQEIADLFGVTLQSVQAIEQSALRKLRRHPLMLELAEEYGLGRAS